MQTELSPNSLRASRSFWIVRPGQGEIRDEPLPDTGPGDVLVRAQFGAISRGTEALVFHGRVPESEYARMRAPFQAGRFPGPVKYGYASVGAVEEGPDRLRGRTVFCLHPHQTAYVVPADAVLPLPAGVPASRAVLAANMETAVNALWDARPVIGDRIAVVGAGVVGCQIAWLAAGIPGAEVELVDIDPARQETALALGLRFATPDKASGERDLVFHTSGAPEGLALALRLAAFEACIVEASWYGDRAVAAPLGEAFHARRLRLISTQVGSVAPVKRGRMSHRDRLAFALGLLTDPALDALISHEIAFEGLPRVMPKIAADGSGALCARILYPVQPAKN